MKRLELPLVQMFTPKRAIFSQMNSLLMA
ncbi:hypothetical protein CGLO_14771 [Colletotrichum gloeosporioides Cg-14]|uniref:Uncharacterized protein n=1 Tax=Colletotrichum gloeosporioides (strain Cg-14) TaxID=1237896 RepID=T0LCZ0_COLGC|nr:hypothetical protein CGLO_14771 [Colletotrichum gloeosporioides Cg-14]